MRSRVLPVLALLLSVLIFFSYTKSVYEESVAKHKEAIAADLRALAAAEDYAARSGELVAAQNAMDQDALGRLLKMLPDSVNNVRSILDLDGLAARTGVAISSIDVSRESAAQATEDGASAQSPVGSVELSLSGKGTYAAFQKFLQGIETSQRLLDITDLTIIGSDTGVYTYQMTARLYWLR
ncbi:MAG TPA: type 4a pilus biogenesis protein PilO [Candidatus Paceibacterota bacterium]|nr:type 4a pilus biogenesis protein PilO [Candidatus Paceibacterota bacterium]